MRYATLCTGIEGFGLGFDRAGMQCVYQCEIDRHCRSVLERHYPDIERGTDVNDDSTAEALVRHRPDILAFGSPCQDLSVAGKGRGLAGQRSGLFFRCVELAYICEAPVVVWENVPGAFSRNKGEDFASVLEAFTGHRPAVPKKGWRNTGVCIGPLYSVAWAVLDSQWFGVPQRRKRIFVVGSLGSRSSPYRILSLAESLPWNPPPSRKAQQGIVGTLNAGSGVRRGAGINPGILTPGPWWNGDDVAPCLDSSMLAKQQMMPEKGRFAAVIQDVTPPLKAGGNLRHDESHDTYIPIAATLNSGGNQGGFRTEPGEHLVPIAYRISPNWGASEQGDRTASLAVRRLTPVECERLQGFPDGWTELGADGKRISNSQRYKMLGNAITVNVAEWLGHRIVTEGGR